MGARGKGASGLGLAVAKCGPGPGGAVGPAAGDAGSALASGRAGGGRGGDDRRLADPQYRLLPVAVLGYQTCAHGPASAPDRATAGRADRPGNAAAVGRADPAGRLDCDGRAGRGPGGYGALDAAGAGRADDGGAGPDCALRAAPAAGGGGDTGGGVGVDGVGLWAYSLLPVASSGPWAHAGHLEDQCCNQR